MSGLKKFLDRRTESIKNDKGIVTKKTETKIVLNNDVGYIEYEQEVDEVEETQDLTDDEFWDISNQFNLEVRRSKNDPAEILQKILENYSSLKIEQFAKRYKELNS